jgi:tetratricopeptide (TPR) repeat protein
MTKFVCLVSIALINVQIVHARENSAGKLIKDAFASSDQDRAILYLDQAYRLDNEDFAEELAFAIHNDKEKARTALPWLSALIAKHPNNKYLYHLRGCGKLVIEEYETAIDDISKAIEIEPLFSGAYSVRAFAFKQKGDEIRYRRDMDAKLVAEKKVETVLNTCETRIRKSPLDATLYIERAKYRELQGKKQDAKADRQKAADIQRAQQEKLQGLEGKKE